MIPRHKKIMLIKIVLICAVALVLFYFFFRWFERANVWIPRDDLIATPEAVGLTFEDVYFETTDNVKLHGWYLPSDFPRASLLFCHGNGGNLSYRTESLRQLQSLNLDIFIFDYRGYGQSEGTLSEEGTYNDALAAHQWLFKKNPNQAMIIYGRSLGGNIAADLATRVNADALILESAFTCVADMGRELFPFLPVRLLNTIEYDALSKMMKIRMPTLIIHSRDDDIVPYHHGQTLYAAALPPKELLTISGSHNEGYLLSEDEYLLGVNDFITKYIDEKDNDNSD